MKRTKSYTDAQWKEIREKGQLSEKMDTAKDKGESRADKSELPEDKKG